MQAALAKALREFADAVKAKTGAAADGEPEAQLSAPVSSLIDAVGRIVHRKIVVKAESALGKRLGIPDFAVVADGTLCGYVELKAPGEGANTSRYRGRNKAQWERFKSQPNVIYTDGNEWCVYQSGEPAERLLRFTKDLTEHGAKGVTNADAEHFRAIVTKFLAWSPIVPQKPRDQAALLAPLCRLLRDDVTDALRDPDSPLVALARDWRSLLFPDASDERFADAYAQTVTFALLLARSEGADVADLPTAAAGLEARHSLLSRALQVLTDPGARREIETSLSLLQRVINAFPVGVMQPVREEGDETEEDPWLYFYEHFLSVYDPKLRRDSGVYYTPVQVVQCQVALIDELLRNRLNRPGGFAHKDVITLDPAVGTGTYLLGVIDHALDTVNKTQGPGAVPARATTLAANVHGFEIMVGPYAVSELRVTRALRSRGADLPDNGLGVYLTDTLDSPYASPPTTPFILKPLADQHRFALNVKDKKSIIVCLGNPPYDRHEAVGAMEGEAGRQNRARTGGWVRWGEETREVRQNAMRLKGGKLKAKYERGKCILDDFSEPVKLAGHGGDLKNLYNLYVYFWRWALWKVFEHPPEGSSGRRRAGGENAGVVSFISASSYTRGDAYVGMREMLRRLCHELWIIDLGGEGRGTRRDDNVFSIQTPVAICVALRTGRKDKNEPAAVRYTRVHGTREEKYAKLAAVHSLVDLTWKPCPMDWHAPLRPKGTGPYYGYPLLNDLMPWQQSGLKVGRVWPIAPDPGVLKRRWKRLMLANSGDRGRLFKDSPTGQKVNDSPISLLGTGDRLKAISELPRGSACPELRRYAHRSYDRQWLLADARVLDRPGPPLWIAHSEQQVYFTCLRTPSRLVQV